MNLQQTNKESSLVGKAAWLTISKILTLTISLLTSMLLSRFRSLDEYGTYSEIMMVVTLTVSVVMLGLPNSLNYFFPRADTQEEKDKFLSVYYTATTILSIIAGVLLIVCIPFLVLYFDNPKIVLYSYVLGIIPWTKVIIGGRSHLLVASNQVNREIFYNICNSVALLGIIVLTKMLDQTFSFYMIAYVLVEIVFSIFVYKEAFELTKHFKIGIDKTLFKSILIFSIPLGLSAAMGTLCTEIDKFMIGWFYDTEMVAIYSNAGKELPIVYISSSFTAVTMPQIVKLIKGGEKKRAINIWKNAADLCFVFMSMFSAICIVFAPQIITILYSTKYLEGVTIFRIYSVSLLCRITYWGMILNAYGQSRLILYNSIISLCSNIILNFVCYFIFGISGPAIATMLSLGITIFYQLRMTGKYTQIGVAQLMPWKSFANTLIVNVFLGLITFALVRHFNLKTSIYDCCVAIVLGGIWLGVYGLVMRRKIKFLIKQINS